MPRIKKFLQYRKLYDFLYSPTASLCEAKRGGKSSPKAIFLLFFSFFFIFTLVCFLFWAAGRYVTPIMMYHNVEYLDHHEANWVNPENFERHMAYLKKHNFRVLSLDEFVRITQEKGKAPRKSVVITFDDGYENNYTYALEILKQYRFPAILFVPTDLVGEKGHLSWEQIKEMAASGINIGSHGLSGGYLPGLFEEELDNQIKESKRILEEAIGKQIKYFAYPIGGFSERIKEIIKDAGYNGACATNRGFDRLNKDVYELNRIRFSNKDNRDIVLWAKFSGYYNMFRKAKNPY